jgi:hypothetical protein
MRMPIGDSYSGLWMLGVFLVGVAVALALMAWITLIP